MNEKERRIRELELELELAQARERESGGEEAPPEKPSLLSRIGENLTPSGALKTGMALSQKVGESLDPVTGAPVRAGLRYGAAKAAQLTTGENPIEGVPYSKLSKPFSGEEMAPTYGKTGGEIVAGAGNMAADLSLLAGPAGKLGTKLAGSITGLGGKIFKAGASFTTGLGPELFEKASTKAGRKAIEGMAGKSYEVGQQLKKLADDPWKYIPEGKIVDKALPKMGNIDISNTLKSLEKSIDPNPIGSPNKSANKAIKELINDIEETSLNEAEKKGIPIGTISAEEFRKVRTKIDRLVNWDDPSFQYLNNAEKSARSAMAKDLVSAAEKTGNPEYVSAMKTMSDKLGKFEDLRESIRKNPQSFINNLMSMNKDESKILIGEIEKITGKEFLEKAQLLQWAKELAAGLGGKAGKVPWGPTHTTGKALIATPIAAAAGQTAGLIGLPTAIASVPVAASLMSPKVATRIYGATKSVAGGLKKAAPIVGKAGKSAYGGLLLGKLGKRLREKKEEE